MVFEKKDTFTARQNSSIFTHYIRQHSISSEEFMVSFDMKSLFTSIPVNLSLTITKDRLQRDQNLAEHTNLSVENILRLSDFVLNHNYFKYDSHHYKQIWLCDGFSHWSCFRWPGNGRIERKRRSTHSRTLPNGSFAMLTIAILFKNGSSRISFGNI